MTEYDRTCVTLERWFRRVYGRQPSHYGYHEFWRTFRAQLAGWRSVFGPRTGPIVGGDIQ